MFTYTFQNLFQSLSIAVRSAISLADSPLVFTVGTLELDRVLSADVAFLVVPVLLVFTLVRAVVGGVLRATVLLAVVDTELLAAALDEAPEDDSPEEDPADGDPADVETIEAPGVSELVDVAWPPPAEVQPDSRTADPITSPHTELRRINFPLGSACADNSGNNTGSPPRSA